MAARRRMQSRTLRSTAPHTTRARTRTVEQVAYQTPSKGGVSGTTIAIGAAALAAGAAVLLFSGNAPAAPGVPGGGGGGGASGTPGTPGVPGPQGQPGPAPAPAVSNFPQVPGAPAGFAGPGMYRVVAPSGLNVRPTPSATPNLPHPTLPPGTTVQVTAPAPNGWVQISAPQAGFLCISCPDAPGGPWLLRIA